MYRLLTLFVIASVLAIGVSSAYAQEQIVNATATEDSIIVPFIPNSRICGFNDNGNYVCEWNPDRYDLQDAITNGTDSVPNPVEASTTTCPDRFKLQEDGKTCLPIVCDEGEYLDLGTMQCTDTIVTPQPTDKEYIKYQNKLGQYIKVPPTTWDQLDESFKLDHLIKCQQGLDQARGIQTERSFITSSWTEEPTVPKAIDADLIDLAIEECEAQTKLLPLLGDYRQEGDVRSAQGWHGYVQPYHAEMVLGNHTGFQFTHANLSEHSEHDIIENNEKIGKLYCSLKWITPVNAEQYGCTPKEIVNVGGYIETVNDVENLWKNYLENGDEQQRKQIKADALKAKQEQLYEKEMRMQTHDYSVTEEFRDIIEDGWNMKPRAERDFHCWKYNPDWTRNQYLKECGE